MKKQIIYLSLLLLLPFVTNAEIIFDMINNQEYQFDNYSKEINSNKPYVTRRIELTYYAFRDNPTVIQKKINNDVFKLCVDYVETEAKFSALHREVNLRLNVYNELRNSRNNYEYNNIGEATNPQLTGIACEVKSIVANQAIYEIKFLFEVIKPSNNYENEKFNIRHYYHVDLLTGKTEAWKPNININNEKNIEGLVAIKFTKNYLLITEKMNLNELAHLENAEEGNSDLSQKKSKTTNFFETVDLNEADFYWYNYGLMIQFQENTKSTIMVGGKLFRVFFPYEEALKITAFIPEFSVINNFPTVKTEIRNWNYKELNVSDLRNEPSILELVKQSQTKIKTLREIFTQVIDNGNRLVLNKRIYEFNAKQDLLSELSYERDKLMSSVFYDYDANDNVKLKTEKEQDRSVSTISYEYDTRNNLKESTSTDGNQIEANYFFYNKNFVYSISQSLVKADEEIRVNRYEKKDKMFCTNNACYVKNERGKVIGIISNKGMLYQGQIGRDKLGRVVETHFENDRYSYYFDYDGQGRFKNFKVEESQRLKKEVTFKYESDKHFPTLITTQNQNSSKIEKAYEWDAFLSN